jgi:hypothetical protein
MPRVSRGGGVNLPKKPLAKARNSGICRDKANCLPLGPKGPKHRELPDNGAEMATGSEAGSKRSL